MLFQVVTICVFENHCVMVLIDMKKQKIWINDPKNWGYKETDRNNEKKFLIPLSRVFPQIMKAIQYYESQKIKNPRYTQWEVCFLPANSKNAYKQKQTDSVSSPLYSLKQVERTIAKTPGPKGLNNIVDLDFYRYHIARTIYGFSTTEGHSPIPMEKI